MAITLPVAVLTLSEAFVTVADGLTPKVFRLSIYFDCAELEQSTYKIIVGNYESFVV